VPKREVVEVRCAPAVRDGALSIAPSFEGELEKEPQMNTSLATTSRNGMPAASDMAHTPAVIHRNATAGTVDISSPWNPQAQGLARVLASVTGVGNLTFGDFANRWRRAASLCVSGVVRVDDHTDSSRCFLVSTTRTGSPNVVVPAGVTLPALEQANAVTSTTTVRVCGDDVRKGYSQPLKGAKGSLYHFRIQLPMIRDLTKSERQAFVEQKTYSLRVHMSGKVKDIATKVYAGDGCGSTVYTIDSSGRSDTAWFVIDTKAGRFDGRRAFSVEIFMKRVAPIVFSASLMSV
jgi:hypothetical protein